MNDTANDLLKTGGQALEQLLLGESAKLAQQHASSLLSKYGKIKNELFALNCAVSDSLPRLTKLAINTQLKFDPTWGAFSIGKPDLDDVQLFKFIDTVGGALLRQIHNSLTRLHAIAAYSAEFLPVFSETQITYGALSGAEEAAARLFATSLEEFESSVLGFEKLVAGIYLNTRREYKKLRRKYLGEASKQQDDRDSLEEDMLMQLFGAKPQQRDQPLGLGTALLDDNCVLTQLLSDLSDALPKHYEKVVPIMHKGAATSTTKMVKTLDDGEVEDCSRMVLASAHPTYVEYARSPNALLCAVMETLIKFHDEYSRVAAAIRSLVQKSSLGLTRPKRELDHPMVDPRSISRQYARINFLAIRPSAEDVAPRTRMERDFAEARQALFEHLKETLFSLSGMDRCTSASEEYALKRTREAVELRAELDEVAKSEHQKTLSRNIRDDNEFYVGKGGKIGELEVEREAAPKIKYEDVVGESFVRAKAHVEEVVKIASHPQTMRISAPRGDVKSNLMLIGPFGCIAGNSLIDMPRDLVEHPDGIPIKTLVGKRPWVYSFDEKQQRIACNRASVVVKTGTKPVHEVAFRWKIPNGRGKWTWAYGSIRATQDHEFLVRKRPAGSMKHGQIHQESEGYSRLDELHVGDRLVSLSRRILNRAKSKGKNRPYARLSLNDGTLVLEHIFVATAVHGKLSEVVHHVDDVSLNNDPMNLDWMTDSEHKALHLGLQNKSEISGWKRSGQHPRGMLGKRHHTDKHRKAAQVQAAAIAEDRRRVTAASFNGREGLESLCAAGLSTSEIAERVGVSRGTVWNWLERWGIDKPNFRNHEVISITLAGTEDVYDMTVPGTHNYVANGVVVHNCGKTEMAKAVCADRRIIGFSLSAADILTAYMHESVKNLKRMFDHAKNLRRQSRYTKPVGIVLDEFDSFFSYGEGVNQAYDGPRMQKVLQEMMDGVVGYEGVFLVALTNEPKIVPEAVLRRFKYVDVVGQLTASERTTLFKQFLNKGLPMDPAITDEDYAKWAEAMNNAPGDVLGKIADEVHFKFMREFVDAKPKRALALERSLAKRLKNREISEADRALVRKSLGAHRTIDAAAVTAAVDDILKQPQVRMQINKAKEVYRDAEEILSGLSVIGDRGLGFGANVGRRNKLWNG